MTSTIGAALRPLSCPYCAGTLTADLVDMGHAYAQYQVVGSYSCDDCGAQWHRDGTPDCGPYEHCWRIGQPEDAVPPWLVTP